MLLAGQNQRQDVPVLGDHKEQSEALSLRLVPSLLCVIQSFNVSEIIISRMVLYLQEKAIVCVMSKS